MATAAFRSTSKRTSIGGAPATSTDNCHNSTSSNRSSAHRRSRSLSRFSRPISEPEMPFPDEAPTPRARFVNTVRGSGFPEISLDELAIDFFSSGDRGRSASKNTDVNSRKSDTASQRRGRSVSRHSSRTGGGSGGGSVVDRGSSVRNASVGGRTVSESTSRRRRSVSVVRCPISDSESDLDIHNASSHTKTKSFSNGNSQKALSGKTTATNQRQTLRRLSSQRDLKSYDDDSVTATNQRQTLRRLSSQRDLKSYDDDSSDLDISHNASTRAKMKNFSNGNSQKASLGKSNTTNQRQLLRKCSSQKDLKSYDCNSSQSSALTDDEVKDGYTTKNGMERIIRAVYSQKKADHPVSDDVNGALYEAMRKDLRRAVEEIKMEIGQDRFHSTSPPKSGDQLAEKTAEVVDSDSSRRKNYPMKVDQLSERRTNDKKRMSKRLTEEAEKYIDDFISNIEDTDMSSIDGERSDTSSSLGVVKLLHTCYETTPLPVPPKGGALPLEMDGVVLPWLQWETSDDITPQSSKQKKIEIGSTTPTNAHEEESNKEKGGSQGYYYSMSSQGSCTPGTCPTTGRLDFGETKIFTQQKSPPSPSSSRRTTVDLDDYMNIVTSEEELIFERWSQHKRISSGGLLLCNHMAFF